MKYKTINDIPEPLFVSRISSSNSRSDFLRSFGMSPRGAKFTTLNKRIEKLGIDISHFKSPSLLASLVNTLTKEEVIEKHFTKNSKTRTTSLRRFILRFCLIEYECRTCKNNGIHNNLKLTLQIDHINGDPSDNRLENLRFLCPNCHSQTKTFSGKNKKKEVNKGFICPSCGSKKSHQGKVCKKCYKPKKKIIWPDDNTLSSMLKDSPRSHVARLLGVSDTAIKKRCKARGIAGD